MPEVTIAYENKFDDRKNQDFSLNTNEDAGLEHSMVRADFQLLSGMTGQNAYL